MSEIAPVAIVTGGAQGLGASICVSLLLKGYKVCVADIQESKGKKFVEEQLKIHGSGNVIFSLCDVTKEADYSKTFEDAVKVFHRVDVLVNNAGIILEQEPQKVLNVNLMGPIIGCQMAIKYMGKSNGGEGGIVINVASIGGFIPHCAMPVYCASKHGVIGLTRSYGLPYHEKKDSVIFTALCPALTDTDLLKTTKENSLVASLDFSKYPNLLSSKYVAQGVIKLLEDRVNGSTLGVTKELGYQYLGYLKEFEGNTFE